MCAKLRSAKVLGPEAFTISPLEAAARLGSDVQPVSALLRATSRRAWYEFVLADGVRRAISAQDGGELAVLMTPEEIDGDARLARRERMVGQGHAATARDL